MTADFISLAIVAVVAFLCPMVAASIPGKPVPETVFLLVAGMVLGPHVLNKVWMTESLSLVSDLGLAFLFLLAGFEIDPKNLTGHQGKVGLATWAVTFAIAFAGVFVTPFFWAEGIDGLAVTIALTTTALGTLMPIMAERGLVGTRVGEAILAFGTWGELCPVLAMALLLSTRSKAETLVVLAVFIAVCVVAAVIPARARRAGTRVYRFIASRSDTTSQTFVRFTVMLLMVLVAFSAVFDLDIVLGAFAAGFVLRYILPEGYHVLETKLEGISYGFLIPVFFCASGAKIDVAAVFAQPGLLVGFIVALLLVRAVPIMVAQRLDPAARDLSVHDRLTVAFYCTTALPVIVAVTSVAVTAGAMDQGTASTLVAAGAVTVLLMPLLAQLTHRLAGARG